MIKIGEFKIEGLSNFCVTDNKHPRFSYFLDSDEKDVKVEEATININGIEGKFDSMNSYYYSGEELKAEKKYTANLLVTLSDKRTLKASLEFEMGLLDNKWEANWISDGSYKFVEKKVSPIPMVFKKEININKTIKSAKIYATALGIYEIEINGKRVGDHYFAPGFTTYKSQLQYQVYDVKDYLDKSNSMYVTVAGGWAVGSFVMNRKNRITAPRQALLLELHIEYNDGSNDVIKTDESWSVSEKGPVKAADFYDGETYDATIKLDNIEFRKATIEKVAIKPQIIADYGNPVIRHEVMNPVTIHRVKGKLVYDFGQNFAGVLNIKFKKSSKGQSILCSHAEILNSDGTLNTVFLRSAKCQLKYICSGEKGESFSPTFTYMGFRYAEIEGAKEEDIEVNAFALYSDIKQIGDFKCSNELVNRLQKNIIWSSKSNFMDIPTDCPQRDERMGWTGDINVFSPTACFNFDVDRFLTKWMKDVRAEQGRGGAIPNTIPSQGYGFPETMPLIAVDFWGDAIIQVPMAMYRAYGDKKVLEDTYESMKKYVKACLFWANLIGVGKSRYIWSSVTAFHFGDWVAPDLPKMGQWQARHKWTATASLFESCKTVAEIASILGKTDDIKHYENIASKVADAYECKFTDKNGKLKNEFQTAYVLPIHFGMFNDDNTKKATQNLVNLVKKNDYCIGTGFPGTPYILFSLADNGAIDTAYKMLLNTKCPSWLYEAKVGGTTIWERWDGLDENGKCEIGDSGTKAVMISYNHYASGAVGNFLYTRVLGLEPIKPGYKEFNIKPIIGEGISSASGYTHTPFGLVKVDWKKKDKGFTIDIKVPVGTVCHLYMPSGKTLTVENGEHSFKE